MPVTSTRRSAARSTRPARRRSSAFHDDEKSRRLPEPIRLLDAQTAGKLAVVRRERRRKRRVLPAEDRVLARGEIDHLVFLAVDARELRGIERACRRNRTVAQDEQTLVAL